MNEVALITGVAGGIGQAICERLLARGMRLLTEFGSRDALITSYTDNDRLASRCNSAVICSFVNEARDV
jgi:NAD(P)-dependent dehydrogenase (short-subunit alcohol dehydrogenase family)